MFDVNFQNGGHFKFFDWKFHENRSLYKKFTGDKKVSKFYQDFKDTSFIKIGQRIKIPEWKKTKCQL